MVHLEGGLRETNFGPGGQSLLTSVAKAGCALACPDELRKSLWVLVVETDS